MCSVTPVTTLNSDARHIEDTPQYFSTETGKKFNQWTSAKPIFEVKLLCDWCTSVVFVQHECAVAVFYKSGIKLLLHKLPQLMIFLCSQSLLIKGFFTPVGLSDICCSSFLTGNMILLILSCEAAFNCFPASSFLLKQNRKYWVHAVVHSCCRIVSGIMRAWKKRTKGLFYPALSTHNAL